MEKSGFRFEIFCDPIDNYGDVGFCWRLARELVDRFNCSVVFRTRDVDLACKFAQNSEEIKETIFISGWDESKNDEKPPADFLLAGFSCALPESTISRIMVKDKKPILINIEYLSAENWVESFHGKPSIDNIEGMKIFFYFPGFTEKTGGLLREKSVFQSGDNNRSREKYFSGKFHFFENSDKFTIFIFSYEAPWIKNLLNLWIKSNKPVRLVVIDKKIIKNISCVIGLDFNEQGSYQFGNLEIVVLPFLSHFDFDVLLNISDFNIVRGEDSLVRALWAMKPFLWDIYKQENDDHLNKLFSFNEILTKKWPHRIAEIYFDLSLRWNTGKFSQKDWVELVKEIDLFKYNIENYVEKLKNQEDMATSLMKFCHSVV